MKNRQENLEVIVGIHLFNCPVQFTNIFQRKTSYTSKRKGHKIETSPSRTVSLVANSQQNTVARFSFYNSKILALSLLMFIVGQAKDREKSFLLMVKAEQSKKEISQNCTTQEKSVVVITTTLVIFSVDVNKTTSYN